MTELILLASVLLVVQGILGVYATSYSHQMVDEVNKNLPDSEQFTHEWWYFPKGWRLWKLHWRFYPVSRTRERVYFYTALQLAFGIPFVACLWLIFGHAD